MADLGGWQDCHDGSLSTSTCKRYGLGCSGLSEGTRRHPFACLSPKVKGMHASVCQGVNSECVVSHHRFV